MPSTYTALSETDIWCNGKHLPQYVYSFMLSVQCTSVTSFIKQQPRFACTFVGKHRLPVSVLHEVVCTQLQAVIKPVLTPSCHAVSDLMQYGAGSTRAHQGSPGANPGSGWGPQLPGTKPPQATASQGNPASAWGSSKPRIAIELSCLSTVPVGTSVLIAECWSVCWCP